MENQIIEDRLKRYDIRTLEDEENALKEILQEIALYALSTTDFFSKAAFQGGTSLRIFYGLPRFSEDLDFILKKTDKHFCWDVYIEEIKKVFELYHITPEITDRSKTTSHVQKLFLKDNSLGGILQLRFKHHTQKKLLIKLEVDINPPNGSNYDMKYLEFPIDYSVISQDLASNFAGKCHALLCRPYVKGRDWFDFSWYVANKTSINLTFLKNALHQHGPWKGKKVNMDEEWLVTQLEEKIKAIQWSQAKQEVERFINPSHAASLKVWSQAFFLDKVEKLKRYLLD